MVRFAAIEILEYLLKLKIFKSEWGEQKTLKFYIMQPINYVPNIMLFYLRLYGKRNINGQHFFPLIISLLVKGVFQM